MSRLLFLILILLFLDLFAYNVLKQTSKGRISYPVSIDKHAFIYQKKDLCLEEDEEFRFFEYFGILSAKDPDLHYQKKEDSIDITLNGREFHFPYTVKEKEVIEHETVLIREVPVYIERPAVSSAQRPIEADPVSHEPYLRLLRPKDSFPSGTEISTIIATVRSAIDTNETVTIDYSLVNPNVTGTYPICFLGEFHSCSMNVEIY